MVGGTFLSYYGWAKQGMVGTHERDKDEIHLNKLERAELAYVEENIDYILTRSYLVKFMYDINFFLKLLA